MSNLAHNVITFIPISSSNTTHGPNNPNSQLVLAENNVGNEITISGMMNQSVNIINTDPMLGTYTGNFSGLLYDMTPVGGTLSMTVGLTGPGYFDGHALLNNNGAGNIELEVYKYGDRRVRSSG